MNEQIFIDEKGQELIVRHRKSAVFFIGKANHTKANGYGAKHAEYICIKELAKAYSFSTEEFERFVSYCEEIASESWKSFNPREADSMGAEYDDYYDRDFDNNGRLSVQKESMRIEGPYTQLKSKGEFVRLIKFNKRQFESFVYDLTFV